MVKKQRWKFITIIKIFYTLISTPCVGGSNPPLDNVWERFNVKFIVKSKVWVTINPWLGVVALHTPRALLYLFRLLSSLACSACMLCSAEQADHENLTLWISEGWVLEKDLSVESFLTGCERSYSIKKVFNKSIICTVITSTVAKLCFAWRLFFAKCSRNKA